MQEVSERMRFQGTFQMYNTSPYESSSCCKQTNYLQSAKTSRSSASLNVTSGYLEEPYTMPNELKTPVQNHSQHAICSSRFSCRSPMERMIAGGFSSDHHSPYYNLSYHQLENVEARSNSESWVRNFSPTTTPYDSSGSSLPLVPLPVKASKTSSQTSPTKCCNEFVLEFPQQYNIRVPMQTTARSSGKPSNGRNLSVLANRKNSSKRLSRDKQHDQKVSRLMKPVTSYPFQGVGTDFVFVWDLDETVIIFNSLFDGSFAQRFGTDLSYGLSLALKMEELIFFLTETHFFLTDLSGFDQVHINDASSADNGEDLSDYSFVLDGFSSATACASGTPVPSTDSQVAADAADWMRKLAFRYRKIKDIYNINRKDVGVLLGPIREQEWHQLRYNIDRLTGGWLSVAFRSLTITSSRSNCINVLVTTTHIVSTIAKVLLFGLGGIFHVSNLYCAAKVGKVECFEQITARFGRKCTYLVIGDGYEEEMSAKQRCWPFWRISNHSDLYALQHALDLGYL